MDNDPRDPSLASVRADVPHVLAPTIRYSLLATTPDGTVPVLERIYVDIRDL